MTTKTWTDPIVDEIHRYREEMAKEVEYDLHRLVERLKVSQLRHGNRLVSLPPKEVARDEF